MGTSVLASLTSQVMGEKKAAAPRAKLTPVEGEKAPVVAETGAPFPYDRLDVIEQALANIEREVGFIREGLGLIKAAAPIRPEDAQKAKERAADEQFAERMARQQAEAQAATFLPVPDDGTHDWLCPTHDKAIVKRSPSPGRELLACPDCKLFAR